MLNSKVSVIMVTYNHEVYIEDAITSIFRQSYSGRFQFIISNDCSTDKTHEIIIKCLSNIPENIDVLYLENKENLGGVRNFNQCLAKVNGDFIVVADGDDISCENRLETLVDQHRYSGKSLYVSNSFEINEKGEVLPYSHYSKNNFFSKICLSDIYTSNTPVFGASFAFDSNLIEKYGFINEKFVCLNNVDQNLFWRAYFENGIEYLTQELLFYRHSEQGASFSRKKAKYLEEEDFFKSQLIENKDSLNVIGNLVYVLNISVLLDKKSLYLKPVFDKLESKIFDFYKKIEYIENNFSNQNSDYFLNKINNISYLKFISSTEVECFGIRYLLSISSLKKLEFRKYLIILDSLSGNILTDRQKSDIILLFKLKKISKNDVALIVINLTFLSYENFLDSYRLKFISFFKYFFIKKIVKKMMKKHP